MSYGGMPSSSHEPSVEEIYERLMQLDFTGSRFPDTETLSTLGILEEVQDILGKMRISSVVTMNHEAYQKQTCMFLASLEVTYCYDDDEADRTVGGFITFKDMDGKTNKLTFGQLWGIYGFNCMKYQPNEFENVPEEVELVWDEIAAADFEPGRTKSSSIRHPAIRYVQQILANSFYSRKDTNIVIAEEMNYLRLGLHEHVCNSLQNDNLFPSVYELRPCPLKLFLEQLLTFKNPNWGTGGRMKPELSIGGWITPIFKYTQGPLGGSALPSKLMDMDYLTETRFIVGSLNSQFCYLFQLTCFTKAIFLLPDRKWTAFDRVENLEFCHDLYNTRAIISTMTPMGSCVDTLSTLYLDDHSPNWVN